MFRKVLSGNKSANTNTAVANILMLASAFIWYFLAFKIIQDLGSLPQISETETLAILGINFAGILIFALIGSILVGKLQKRLPFLYTWMIVGIVLSLIPPLVPLTTTGILVLSATFGAYFGLGMPATMGYFANSTKMLNRGKLAGFSFLAIGIGFALLNNAAVGNILLFSGVLALVRIVGLSVYLLKPKEEKASDQDETTSFSSALSNRSFSLYLLPWIMFNLINYLTIPVQSQLFPEGMNYVRESAAVEAGLIAVFAVVGGFLADRYGRKRLAIFGFAVLGIGYAALGLAQNSASWYFYTAADGVAWGCFYVIFIFTVWGDFAQGKGSEKYYVFGALPYLLSGFMQFALKNYVSQIAPFQIFTFASVFLFVAVLPLVYAPETISEEKMKNQELQNYAEKAIKKANKEKNKGRKTENAQPFEITEETGEKAEAKQIEDEYDEAMKLAEKYY
jgi:MFS family permease